MPKKINVLAVDDDVSFLNSLVRIFKLEPVSLLTTQYPQRVLSILEAENINLVLLDLKMPGQDGLSLLADIKSKFPKLSVVMLTGHGGIQDAVCAVKNGADDFIEKPCPPVVLVELVRGYSVRFEDSVEMLEREEKEFSFPSLVGVSSVMQELQEMIVRVARTKATILLHGETGTGKELVAKAIHAHSLRNKEAFVPVDCATISENILESELFGHKQGSFTGAVCHREGLFAEADRGTLFLDEIGEFHLGLQAKLLRTLQERQIRPIGSNRSISVNVRLIAATNKDLEVESANGNFREDLYHRLSTITLQIPPLRERLEDLPLLVDHILMTMGAKDLVFSEDIMRCLTLYHWPGNIRELQNVLMLAFTLSKNSVITLDDLPAKIVKCSSNVVAVAKPNSLLAHERIALEAILKQTGGNRREAAKLMDISEATLYRKLKKNGLSKMK